MQPQYMIDKVLQVKAEEYHCDIQDFSKSENLVLQASPDKPFFRMISFGNGTVVSTHDELYQWCHTWFGQVEGIFCFDAPKLVEIGLAMQKFSFVPGEIFDWYLPLKFADVPMTMPAHQEITYLENEQVNELYQHKGFDNALTYHDPSFTKMAMAAYHNTSLCAIAGVSSNYQDLWCLGVDVIPEYRKQGIATYLVHSLTKRVLEQGIIPMYPTWYSNIGSRHTALNAGYRPIWVEIGSDPVNTEGR
ncbi:MAG TPA: GNAT family N-acetyltransferase [Anaerolineae bacterium]|nr:GNAT family N-acetyltransferase [Anaerolineae bacterium]